MTHYAKGLVVRDGSNKPHPDRWATGAFGELFIDDGTGFVSAATPAAEKVDATPVKVARLLHVTSDVAERTASTTGQLVVEIPGDYKVYGSGDILGGNASVMKVEVFRNGAVVADAAATPGGSIAAHVVAAAAAVRQSWALVGLLPDMKVGETVDLRVTGSVGTVTIKQLRFGIKLVGDNSEPGEPTT